MRRISWNLSALMVAAAMCVGAGCAKPPAPTAPASGTEAQSGSTTGGGEEVPMPAAGEEAPADPAAEPAPAEPAAAEPAPAGESSGETSADAKPE